MNTRKVVATGVTLGKTITQSTNGMIRLSAVILFFLMDPWMVQAEIMVPSPEIMLSSSEIVAVAKLSNQNGVWIVTLGEVIKGDVREGEKLVMYSPPHSFSMSMDALAREVNQDGFLFVGRLQPMTGKLLPKYGLSSFWPQGIRNDRLHQLTLDEVVTFAKANLGISEGKNTSIGGGAPQPRQPVEQIHLETKSIVKPPPVVRSPDARKLPEARPALPTSNKEPRSRTLWIVGLIMIALGLLWVVFRRRS